MNEIVSPEAAEKTLLFVAVAGPIVGLIVGTMIGAHGKCAWPKMAMGLIVGALGSVVYGMWRLYGAITGALGLDSLANLGLQLVIFVVLGGLLGAAGFRLSLILRKPGTGR